VTAAWGGAVHPLPYDAGGEFWSVATWSRLCAGAARVAARLARDYDELLVVGVDTPFAGLGSALNDQSITSGCRIRTLLAFYSTALIVERPTPNPARVAWERAGVASASRFPNVWIGDVGRYLTDHLRQDYGLDLGRLAPFTSSLNLASPQLRPMEHRAAERVAAAWNVPLDRPIVLTIGRTDPTKGIDLLLDAAAPIRDNIHVVVIAVPLPGREGPP
jgi:glycosyltransferase involved in cell wall biosynthesis